MNFTKKATHIQIIEQYPAVDSEKFVVSSFVFV